MAFQFPHQREQRVDPHVAGGNAVAKLSRIELVAPIITVLTVLCLTFSSSAQAEPTRFMITSGQHFLADFKDFKANSELQLTEARHIQAITASHQLMNANLRATQPQTGVPLSGITTDVQVHLWAGALLLSLGLMPLWRQRRYAVAKRERSSCC